jgi:DNA-binding transcriptional MocR family regulator
MGPSELDILWRRYEDFKRRGLKLDMSRGKPEKAQLDLSLPMLEPDYNFVCEDGIDVRNYGDTTGIPEAKRLFGELLGVPASQVIVGGNSSINLIHDALTRALLCGPMEGDTPWARLPRVKFICPVPGYDWHFHMCETLGIQMLPVRLGAAGPDMDEVERLALDPEVKGFICNPMYSNPSGITYSDETVDRLASMKTAAPDFRIIWDNAYCVHHLYENDRDSLKNIYESCVASGNADRVLMFTSTSKITFAGGGISAMGASPANIARHTALLTYQLVCYDKMNQLRHARFLPDKAAVETHMAKHAQIIRPKFEYILEVLEKELSGIGSWSRPKGGYFICYYAPEGCARRIVELCREAGVTLTPAGSPYPGGLDPKDSTIRIAPTLPPLSELKLVMELFPLAVKIAAAEKTNHLFSFSK